MLVKKISMMDAHLLLKNVGEEGKMMFTGCLSMNSLIVLLFKLFLLLFQRTCLALKSPPIKNCVVGSSVVSLINVLGSIGFCEGI